MARPSRKTAQPFGTSAGTNQIGKFGSLAAASPQRYSGPTADPAVLQSLAQWAQGWSSAVLAGNSPAIEDMNAFCLVMAYQIGYGFTLGIPEWDSGTTYYIGSIAQDGAGNIYKSITNTNLNNALSSTANWAPFITVPVVSPVNPMTASPYTLAAIDAGKTFLVDTSTKAMLFNLPSPATVGTGYRFKVKDRVGNALVNNITMHRSAAELFAGLAADYVMAANAGEWEIMTDGTNWFITGR